MLHLALQNRGKALPKRPAKQWCLQCPKACSRGPHSSILKVFSPSFFSRWGSLAFPAPWKGIFFCPPVSGCSHLFIGVFNAPRLAVEVPTLLKKGATPCPAPHSTVFPLLFPFRRQILRRSARRPPQTRGAQPSKGQGSPSTPLQFMEGRLEASGHAALPRRLLYCIHLAQESRDFSDRGGRQPLGLFGLPCSMEGHFFLPTGFRVLSPIHWCLQCPQACSRGPHSIKKGCHTLPPPHSTGFPLFPPSFFLSGDKY